VDITGVKDLAKEMAAQGTLRPGSEALQWIEGMPDRVPWHRWRDLYPMFLRMLRVETKSR
jgi:hypothetical protein